MIFYTIKLAITNLKNRMDLTLLTIFLVGIGLALLTTMMTMNYQSSKVPVRDKSENIHAVLLDSRDKDAEAIDNIFNLPSMTYLDADNLLRANIPDVENTYLWKSYGFLNSDLETVNPRQARIMAGLSNFFSIFDVPLLYGTGWTSDDDFNEASVVVLSYQMNRHFFGGENSVGKLININSSPMTVVGVMSEWRLPSRFYDRSFSSSRFDDLYMPSSTALNINLPRNISCNDKDSSESQSYSLDNPEGLKASECRWIAVWVEMKDTNSVSEYKSYLDQYVNSQQSLGRFPRSAENILINLEDYVGVLNAGRTQGKIFLILAWLFFAVCLVNTIGLLLAKYMGKISEIALRRALGAKKIVILTQYMIEIAIISFLGSLLGLVFSYFGLIGMMEIFIYQSDYTVTAEAIKHGYQLDWMMIVQGIIIAVGSTLTISLFPVWKICNTPPASQLKAQ